MAIADAQWADSRSELFTGDLICAQDQRALSEAQRLTPHSLDNKEAAGEA